MTLRARAARFLWPGVDDGSMVAVCHCHYPELVPELARQLGRLPEGVVVHLTSSRLEVFSAWDGAWAGRRTTLHFHWTENRGRDLRPFFEVAGRLRLEPNTLVLKIHGKKSAYISRGDRWRRDLIGGLVPGRRRVLAIRGRFAAEPRLALLGAPGSFISHPVYWGRNRPRVDGLMTDLFGTASEAADLGFFAGSMFWIRGSFLAALLPRIDLDAFEPEPLDQDGLYAHAVERVIGMAAGRMGLAVGEIGRRATLDPATVRNRKLDYL